MVSEDDPLDHCILYGGIPPDGLADADPLHKLPQVISVVVVLVVSTKLLLSVIHCTIEHPLTSVMVTQYSPAERPIAS